MATVYKRKEARPIPDGAEIIERKRKATPAELKKDSERTHVIERYAKWTDGKTGRAKKAPLNEAGNRIIQEAETYTAQYFDENGKRPKVPTGCHDKAEAQRYANHLENEARKRRTGQIDPKQERYAKEARRPLSEHIEEFRGYLSAKDNTQDHVHRTCRHIERITEACHTEKIGDLTGAGVLRVIGGLRDSEMGLRTCNAYLRSIKSFARWLWNEKRMPDDPLAGLSQFNEQTDQRHIRRELTADETRWLLTTVEAQGKLNYKLDGTTRAMAYRVALGSGFRRKELRYLTPASFDLDSDPPTVTAKAAYSKRRREDVQPIRPDLAELLRPWLAGFERNQRLFPLPHNTSKMFQRDLAAARSTWIQAAESDAEFQRREGSDFLRYQDADGRVADFHAQRHTYISGIVAGGASVKTCQELARHSTPVLTIGRYSHARLHDLTGALEALPDQTPQETPPQSQATAATGTDGKAAEIFRGQMRGQCNRKTPQDVASSCESPSSENDNAACPKLLSVNTLGDKRRDTAKWSGAGSNRRHRDFQSRALPTELPDRCGERDKLKC